jgi:hypothetical protein
MSTNCDRCGYRDNEVKSGSAISEKGKRITLRVEDREDLSRDILKVRFQLHHRHLLTVSPFRAKRAVSRFQRSTSPFMPGLWEAGSPHWKGSSNKSSRSSLRKYLQPEIPSAAPIQTAPTCQHAKSLKTFWRI